MLLGILVAVYHEGNSLTLRVFLVLYAPESTGPREIVRASEFLGLLENLHASEYLGTSVNHPVAYQKKRTHSEPVRKLQLHDTHGLGLCLARA